MNQSHQSIEESLAAQMISEMITYAIDQNTRVDIIEEKQIQLSTHATTMHDVYNRIEQIKTELETEIIRQRTQGSNLNDPLVLKLEQKIFDLSNEVRLLQQQSEEIEEQLDETQLRTLCKDIYIVARSSSLSDFQNLALDYNAPRRFKEIKTAQERKQERKRYKIMKSKQALSKIKKGIISSLIGVQNFIKNPENIAKLFVIAVACVFVSSLLQIPDMSNRDQLYLFEWLAYNRSSRTTLISGAFCLVSFTWYFMFILWIACVGLLESKGKLSTLIHECNPLLQLTLLFMTDNELINNKFDLAVWFCYLCQFSTFRVYHIHSMNIIKKIISGLSHASLNKLQVMSYLQVFSLIVLMLNFCITGFGILMFHRVGIYAISLLFFGGVTTTIEYIKLYLIANKIQNKYAYFVNSNIDQLSEPQFYQELIPDIFYHFLKTLYCLQLITNYFQTMSLQIFLHLWLFYIVSDLQQQLFSFKKCIDQLIRFRKIQNNVESLFPRAQLIEHDEICSICHDELLVARLLPCGHKFHLKCMFNWLKAQQQCPICRQDVPLVPDPGVGSRLFNLLTTLNLQNLSVLFTTQNN